MRHKFLLNNENRFSPHTIHHRFKNGGTTLGRDDSHHNDTQSNNKHSSLLRKSINYGLKKFYNTAHGGRASFYSIW
jgi:hypothetical protein